MSRLILSVSKINNNTSSIQFAFSQTYRVNTQEAYVDRVEDINATSLVADLGNTS
jgi:hypothetical protein